MYLTSPDASSDPFLALRLASESRPQDSCASHQELSDSVSATSCIAQGRRLSQPLPPRQRRPTMSTALSRSSGSRQAVRLSAGDARPSPLLRSESPASSDGGRPVQSSRAAMTNEPGKIPSVTIASPERPPAVCRRRPPGRRRHVLQRTTDPKTYKERMHLVLETDDGQAEVRRLEALGATR